MSSQATEQGKMISLEALLATCDMSLACNASSRVSTDTLRGVVRVAIRHRDQADDFRKLLRGASEEEEKLRNRLDEVSGDLDYVRGERDKLAAELEEVHEYDGTPFSKALADLGLYHAERLEALPPDDEADDIDPFKHQANAYKHGMGIDSFPLVQVEEALFGNDMGSYESWRRIAHAAVLAMSYLSYVASDSGDALDESDSPEDAA